MKDFSIIILNKLQFTYFAMWKKIPIWNVRKGKYFLQFGAFELKVIK